MKKKTTKDQEQKPRRLRLNRETIRLLNDPELRELVRGGTTGGAGSDMIGNCCRTTSQTSDPYT